MALHLPGYTEARLHLLRADTATHLRLLDDLQGRGRLDHGADAAEVLAEALRQLAEEFTDRSSPEYERREFWLKVNAAGALI